MCIRDRFSHIDPETSTSLPPDAKELLASDCVQAALPRAPLLKQAIERADSSTEPQQWKEHEEARVLEQVDRPQDQSDSESEPEANPDPETQTKKGFIDRMVKLLLTSEDRKGDRHNAL